MEDRRKGFKFNITRNGDRQHSLKRVIAFIGMLTMTIVFIKTAYLGSVETNMFIAYPIGLTILYVPQLAINMLKVWKGQNDSEVSTQIPQQGGA